MYCPKCGQEISDQLRFCSRCGFATNVVAELVKTDGVLTQAAAAELRGELTPRQAGVRQGMLLVFVGVIIVFMLSILQSMIGLPEIYGEVAAGVFLFAGIMRLIYAFGFEEGVSKAKALSPTSRSNPPEQLSANPSSRALRPEQSVPARDLVGVPYDAAELAAPISVTENTTRLLDGREKDAK